MVPTAVAVYQYEDLVGVCPMLRYEFVSNFQIIQSQQLYIFTFKGGNIRIKVMAHYPRSGITGGITVGYHRTVITDGISIMSTRMPTYSALYSALSIRTINSTILTL